MKNKELQELLRQYPDDIDVRLLPKADGDYKTVVPFTDENILHTSETAFIDNDAPEDEWDTEDGKVELGNGVQYLLINPIIT